MRYGYIKWDRTIILPQYHNTCFLTSAKKEQKKVIFKNSKIWVRTHYSWSKWLYWVTSGLYKKLIHKQKQLTFISRNIFIDFKRSHLLSVIILVIYMGLYFNDLLTEQKEKAGRRRAAGKHNLSVSSPWREKEQDNTESFNKVLY